MDRGRARQALAAFSETARSPNLRRAQLSFLGSWMAEWALTVALGILAFRDGGAAAVGVVAMARTLPAALIAPLAAVMVDRYRRERVLAVVCLVKAASLGGAALAVAELSSPVLAYALAAVATLAHTLYRPAHSALLPSLSTTPSQLTSANVVRGLLDSMSAFLGALAAGALVGPIGVSGVFAVSAGASLWAAWLIARVSYEAPPRLEEHARRRAVAEIAEGLAVIRRDRSVAVLTALMFLQTVTRGCFAVFAVVIALELLDTGESGVGVLTAGFGAGAVVGSFAASLFMGSTSFARWFGIAIALWGLPFALLAGVSSEVLAFALLGLVGVANAIVDVTGFTTLQRIVPDEVMGRYFASLEALLTLGVAIGAIATPALIAAFGTRGALVAAGLVAPAGTLLAWTHLRGLDVRLDISARVIGLLQRTPILSPLPIATVAQLADKAGGQDVAPGTDVIREGETGDEFFVIVDGRAEVLQDGQTLRFLDAGDCFGEIAALGSHVRTSTVRAETKMGVLSIRGDHFVRAVTGYTRSRSAADAIVAERLARSASIGD